MRGRFLAKLLIMLPFFFSISCEQEEVKVELLKVTIEPGYFDMTNRNGTQWILVSDASGNTLDFKEVKESDTELVFFGRSATELTLTILSYNFFDNQGSVSRKQYYAESTMGLSLGESVLLKRPDYYTSAPIPEVIAKPSFTLNGYSDSKDINGSFHFSDGYICCYSTLLYPTIEYTPPVFKANFNLRKNPGDLLVVTYRDGIPVHKWIRDIDPSTSVNLDFSSFESTKLIPINKPVEMGEVRSVVLSDYEGDISKGHILSSINNRQFSSSSAASNTYQLGYLDGFDKYFVNVYEKTISCCPNESNVSYTKLGTIPKEINLPNNSFQLVNGMMTQFNYSFTNDYTYKNGFFESKKVAELGISWSITSGKGMALVPPTIPQELLKLHPDLKTEALSLTIINFYHELDGYSYRQKIDDTFTGKRRSAYETIGYSFLGAR